MPSHVVYQNCDATHGGLFQMTFSWNIALFIFFCQFLGYGVKGLVGFGNPLVSSPILSMRLDNIIITPGTLLLDFPINLYLAWKNRKNFQWLKLE